MIFAPLLDTHSRELAYLVFDSFRVSILFLELGNLLDVAVAVLDWVGYLGEGVTVLFNV